jgi:competence ComEA-like helix-hairpin-helix protein
MKLLLIASLLTTLLFSFDVKTADADQFLKFKGIGPVIAGRIIVYRQNHGFETVDDLIKVKGIGPKKLASIKREIKSSESSINVSRYIN